MWDWFVQHQAVVPAITGTVTATCFVLSVIAAGIQIMRAWRSQRQATARSIFNDYLEKAFNNPMFSYPLTYPDKFALNNRTFDGSIADFERYEWFVSILIIAMREILDSLSHDKYWKLTAHRQLSYHIDFLEWRRRQDEADNFVVMAGPKVNAIIDELIRERRRKQAGLCVRCGRNTKGS